MDLATVEADRIELGRGGGGRHHGDDAQPSIRAKPASLTAIDPDDASTAGGCSRPSDTVFVPESPLLARWLAAADERFLCTGSRAEVEDRWLGR